MSLTEDRKRPAAVIETIIASGISLFCLVNLHLTLFIITSTFTSLIFSLRCKDSINLGLDNFRKFENRYLQSWRDNDYIFQTKDKLVLYATALVVGAGNFFLVYCFSKILVHPQNKLLQFGFGLLVGAVLTQVGMQVSLFLYPMIRRLTALVVYALIAPPAMMSMALFSNAWTAAGVTLGSLVGPFIAISFGILARELSGIQIEGIGPSIFPNSVFYRLQASYKHWRDCVKELPKNYRKTTLTMTIWDAPEILPGYGDGIEGLEDIFTVDRFFTQFKKLSKTGLRKYLFLFAILCWYGPGYFYRLVINSTFLFNWIIATILREPKEVSAPKLAYDNLISSAFGGFIASIIGVGYFLLRHIRVPKEFWKHHAIFQIGWIVSWLDVTSIMWFEWLSLISMTAVLLVLKYAPKGRRAVVYGPDYNQPEYITSAESRLVILNWICRAGACAAIFYFGANVIYEGAVYLPIRCDVSQTILDFYGDSSPLERCGAEAVTHGTGR